MFWAPWHQSTSIYFQPSFSSSTWKWCGVWMCKLGMISQERLKIEVKLVLSANRKSYMPCRLAQQRMTLSDLEWPFRASRAISAVAESLVVYPLLWRYIAETGVWDVAIVLCFYMWPVEWQYTVGCNQVSCGWHQLRSFTVCQAPATSVLSSAAYNATRCL